MLDMGASMTMRPLGTLGFALSVLAAVTASPPQARANLVTNGDFETGDLTGWSGSDWSASTFVVISGNYSARCDCQAFSTIVQNLPTEVAHSYDLSFYFRGEQFLTGSLYQLHVYWDGIDTGTIIPSSSDAWTFYTITGLTASSTSTSLSFQVFLADRYDLDNVVVEDVAPTSPTPVPAALPLFATGLGALSLLGWRRKRKTAALPG